MKISKLIITTLVVACSLAGAFISPAEAGWGAQSKDCPFDITYHCPGDPEEYSGICTGSGTYAKSPGISADDGWSVDDCGDANETCCGQYMKTYCAGTPMRDCVDATEYPETKVSE